jgi:hypothetical protein
LRIHLTAKSLGEQTTDDGDDEQERDEREQEKEQPQNSATPISATVRTPTLTEEIHPLDDVPLRRDAVDALPALALEVPHVASLPPFFTAECTLGVHLTVKND